MVKGFLGWLPGPLAVVMLVAASSGLLHAQQGTINGRVVDASGGVLPGATITATNVDTGIKSVAITNEEGHYALPLLPPGQYTVTVTLEGFESQTSKPINLQVQQVAQLDFKLGVGAVAESVDVNAPRLDTQTSSLGQVTDNKRIVELPLNGRNPLDLAKFTPGVNQLATGFLDTRNFNLTSTSINGGQGGSNAVLIDGGSATLPERNEYVVAPNVDAVQEYRVQTNALAAEFGMTGGGVINLVTRSGTNQFRGSLFEFVRDDALDATGWTNNRNNLPKSPLSYHQFGGTIGGPIWLPDGMGPLAYNGRNRSFFFFNYEGIRYDSLRTNLARVPTELERQGDFSQTFIRAGNGALIPVTLFDPATTRNNPAGAGFVRDAFPAPVIPASRLDPVALRAIQYYPQPNRTPADATGRENFISTGAIFSDSNQYTGRVDHQVTAANKLFGRYSQNDHVNTGNPPKFSEENIADPDHSQQTRNNKHVTIGDTHAFSGRLLGEVRLSVARQYLLAAPAGYGVNAAREIGMPPIVPATLFPRFNPPANIPDFNSLGSSPDQLSERGLTQGELTGNVTLVVGRHTIKTGLDVRVNLRNNYQPGQVSGTFEFTRAMSGNPQDTSGNSGFGLATFLLGAVTGGGLNTPISRADGWYYYSAFAQDDYRILPRLTLNLGLRYDVITAPTDRFDRYSNFNPTATNPVTGTPGVLQYAGVDFGRQAYDTDYNNVGPRAGFAYDVFGDGRTLVRGGYGVLYYHSASFDYPGTQGFSVTTPFQSAQGAAFPAFQLTAGPPSLLQPSGNTLGPLSFLGNDVTYFERERPTPTMQQWNVNVQRELPGSTLVELAYAGSRGTHIVGFNYDLNQLPPEYLSLGLALDERVPNPFFGVIPPGTPLSTATITRRQALRPYPAYLNINVTSPPAYSTKYHSAQAKVERRFSKGLAFLGAYTYSRLVGNVGRNFIDFNTVGGAPQGNVQCMQDARFNRRACWSIEPQDVTHTFALTGLYELPFGRGRRFLSEGGVLGQILGEFQMNGAFTLRSGLPLVIRGANNGGVADRPNLVGDPQLSSEDRTPQRWFNTTAFSAAAPFATGSAPRTISEARGPGFASVDLAVTKNIAFTDAVRLQFRTEFFNLFNRVNYMQPDMNFLSAGFGTISTAYEGRRVQFGLKLYF